MPARSRWTARCHLCTLCIVVLGGGLLEAQARSRGPTPSQLIPGTTLRVVIPAEWKIVPGGGGGGRIVHVGEPRYEIEVHQTAANTQGNSCIDLLGSIMAIDAIRAKRAPRPEHVPTVYFQSIADGGQFQLLCLASGTGPVGVSVALRDGRPRPHLLTPLLTALAEGVMAHARVTTVSRPRPLSLPRLEITIVPSRGAWGLQSRTDRFGTHDVLQRVATPDGREIVITPMRSSAAIRCEALMASATLSAAAKKASRRRYGGPAWHPDALEQFPPPFGALQAYVCREVDGKSVLLARIDYELSTIRDDDAELVRAILDDIGDAYQRKASASSK